MPSRNFCHVLPGDGPGSEKQGGTVTAAESVFVQTMFCYL